MSLTSLILYHPEIKALFATIPNMKASFASTDSEELPFPPSPPIVVSRASRATSIIGHAYDYWLRAYIQRINDCPQELHEDSLAASFAVQMLAGPMPSLPETYRQIVDRRNAYITKACDVTPGLIQGAIVLGNLDQYYRSGQLVEGGVLQVNEADVEDLQRLIQETESYSSLFLAQNSLVCNPCFGEAITQLVGGADGDLLMDGMLIDIKVESAFKWKIAHLRQLVGYWILSCLTPRFEGEIEHLAIWNPRCCRLVYIPVQEVCRSINMVEFVDAFLEIICHPKFEISSHILEYDRQRFVEEVLQTWQSADNPIRKQYG